MSSLSMSDDGVIEKDPVTDLDYEFDWSDWLATGESVSTYTLVIPSGLSIGTAAASSTVSAVTFTVSGGTVGISYPVTCEMVTDNTDARTDKKTMTIKVRTQ